MTAKAKNKSGGSVADPGEHHLILRKRVAEGGMIMLMMLALFLLIALWTYNTGDPGWSFQGNDQAVSNAGGRAGAWFADFFLHLFGYLAYLAPLVVAYIGFLVFKGREDVLPRSHAWWMVRGLGLLLAIIAGAGLCSLHFLDPDVQPGPTAGGILGDLVVGGLYPTFSGQGTTLILLAMFLAGLTLFTGISWLQLMDTVGRWTLSGILRLKTGFQDFLDNRRERKNTREQRKRRETAVKKAVEKKATRKPVRIEPVVARVEPSKREQKERQKKLFNDKDPGGLPKVSLLDAPTAPANPVSAEALEAMSRLVELKLADFNIEAEVVEVHPGPVITRFELDLAAGVKVSKITNLAKDLARSLSTISVRIVEVIPGKSVIGLEIPNESREIVRLREVIASRQFDDLNSPLTMALGKDISGNPVVINMAKMPHLLVAGTTGSGKSVGLNAMILSILYKSTPEQVRMIMIDPKMLELSVYEGIPHLLTPVVTDMKEAANALRWCVGEMERRYRLMSKLGVRNLAGYNRKIRDAKKAGEEIPDPTWTATDDLEETPPNLEPLPSIVVVIDELADMMMIVGKKVEELIARIAQKARAAGIHLLLATQRPSVDVITGLIKANIPSRIAFQVSSRIDSRTILDQMGAEQLLGQGDMLYLPGGTSIPVRVHGAFVDDDEVHRVVEDWQSRGEPTYEDAITSGEMDMAIPGMPGGGGEEGGEVDELYDQAVRIVTESRRASISGIQRRLKIGYNRAARMIEEMESAGVVSEMQSNGSREVLAPPPPKD